MAGASSSFTVTVNTPFLSRTHFFSFLGHTNEWKKPWILITLQCVFLHWRSVQCVQTGRTNRQRLAVNFTIDRSTCHCWECLDQNYIPSIWNQCKNCPLKWYIKAWHEHSPTAGGIFFFFFLLWQVTQSFFLATLKDLICNFFHFLLAWWPI